MQRPLEILDFFYREAPLDYRVEPHFHRHWQWYVVVHGQVIYKMGNEEFVLEPQHSLLVPPGILREPKSGKRAPGYMLVSFNNHALNLSQVNKKILTLPGKFIPDLRDLLDEIRNPVSADSQMLVEAIITRLLIGVMRQGGQNAKTSAPLNLSSAQEVINRAEFFMKSNLFRTLSREDIAQAVHYSQPHMARLFKKITGKTPIERLTELRIEKACQLLIESSLPVTRIALEVGFNSFSHFTKLFKNSVGMPASEYRRKGGRMWKKN